MSVDYVNSQSDNGKRKKSKHKKKKKDKDRERDRDKDKKSKHEGSSDGGLYWIILSFKFWLLIVLFFLC